MKRLLGIALGCGLAFGPAAGGAQARDFTTKIDNADMPLSTRAAMDLQEHVHRRADRRRGDEPDQADR